MRRFVPGYTPIVLLGMWLVAAVTLTACAEAPEAGDEEPFPEAPVSKGGSSVMVTLTASGISFDAKEIRVPAGARVTVRFTNEDAVSHNFAVYGTSAGTDIIFRGEIIPKGTVDYEFVASETPGTYFFRCDVHPAFMNGDFIVEEDG